MDFEGSVDLDQRPTQVTCGAKAEMRGNGFRSHLLGVLPIRTTIKILIEDVEPKEKSSISR